MAVRAPTFYPERCSVAVRGMTYSADFQLSGPFRAQLGAPIALNSTGILAAQSINTAGSATTFAATYSSADTTMGIWGRCLRLVLSGAGTPTVDIRGRDYLGQRVRETLTGNGVTPVLGVKAFKHIDSITWTSVGGTTMDIGWRDCFGLPYKFKQLLLEQKNGIVAANAGTFVAGLASTTAATATNADVRGTYLPSTVIPDGTNTFEVIYMPDELNLHGNAQFYS